jgi:hypothetical protein
MHEEWSRQLASSSWNGRRLVASALVVTLAMLGLGVGVAGLVVPDTVAARSAPETDVAGAAELAPETEIGDAVVAVREGPFEPAPTEHLTVVHVSVSVCGVRSTGSGVVVGDGLLLTAAHVVGDATLVRIDQGGITVTGEVLGVLGDDRDLALVAVDAPMAVPLAPVATPPVGAPLTLVGYPDGGRRTSAVGARVEVAPTVAMLAGGGDIVGVDVHIEAGISGGPAVSDAGAIVGIVVAKEAVSDTALVVATPDLASLSQAALVPGTCVESA